MSSGQGWASTLINSTGEEQTIPQRERAAIATIARRLRQIESQLTALAHKLPSGRAKSIALDISDAADELEEAGRG